MIDKTVGPPRPRADGRRRFVGRTKLGALSTVGDGRICATGSRSTCRRGLRFEERTFSNDAEAGPTRYMCLAAYSGQSLPVVVMLHGCTQNPTTSPLAHG